MCQPPDPVSQGRWRVFLHGRVHPYPSSAPRARRGPFDHHRRSSRSSTPPVRRLGQLPRQASMVTAPAPLPPSSLPRSYGRASCRYMCFEKVRQPEKSDKEIAQRYSNSLDEVPSHALAPCLLSWLLTCNKRAPCLLAAREALCSLLLSLSGSGMRCVRVAFGLVQRGEGMGKREEGMGKRGGGRVISS